jgi:putative methionine-R-sulfoxide reductase with GAF domain
LSRQEVLSILAGRLQEILPCDCLAFYARHDSTLVPEYAAGTHIETLSRLKVPMGHGLSGWVAANGRSILNGNPSVDSSSLIGLRSALAIPLEGEDDVAGVLTLFRAKPDAFSAMDLLELSALGDALGDLMESGAARPVPRQNVIAMAPQPVPRARTVTRSLQPV